jgi:hypothetical protein
MNHLTLLTFKKLFDDLRYEDGEQFINNEFKNRINNKIFFYYNVCDEISSNFCIILANDKKEAIEKLLDDPNLSYKHVEIYKYRIGKHKCLICNMFFNNLDSYNRLLQEHFNLHTKESIIELLINKEDLFISIKLI